MNEPFSLPLSDWRSRSSVQVSLPPLRPLLGAIRERFTRGGRSQEPHITLLHPFYAPPEITQEILERIDEAIEGAASFVARFSRCGRFPQGVCYLAPDDPEPFRNLGHRVQQAFPEMPLYDGQHAEFHPHVTFFDAALSLHAAHDEAESIATIDASLPVEVEVQVISLVQRTRPDPHPWDEVATFPLCTGNRDETANPSPVEPTAWH